MIEREKALKEVEGLLVQARWFRRHMDLVRFADPEAKETSRRLKSGLSTAITCMTCLSNLMLTGNPFVVSAIGRAFQDCTKLMGQGLENCKRIHRDMLREFYPEEIEKLRELN